MGVNIMRRIYENVTKRRLDCMRRQSRKMILDFASSNGYTVERLQLPEGDEGLWEVMLKGRPPRPDIYGAVYVKRNPRSQLIVEVRKIPPFIPLSWAIRKADEVYRGCRP